jgi:ribonuclease J
VLLGHEKAGRLLLDGDVILPADGATIVERRRLMMNGLMAVAVVLDREGRLAAAPVVNAQGVPVEADKDAFLAECSDAAAAAVKGGGKPARPPRQGRGRGGRGDGDAPSGDKLVDDIRVAVRRVAREWTGKKPVTEVQIVRLG